MINEYPLIKSMTTICWEAEITHCVLYKLLPERMDIFKNKFEYNKPPNVIWISNTIIFIDLDKVQTFF